MIAASIVVDFYDGQSAKRHAAVLAVVDGTVAVSVEGMPAITCPQSEIKVLPGLRGTPRRIGFPGGAVAVTQDNAWVDEVFQVPTHATLALRLESHIGFVMAAILGIAMAMVLGYLYGIPWAAR